MSYAKIRYLPCATDRQDPAAGKPAPESPGVAPDRVSTDPGLTEARPACRGSGRAIAAMRRGEAFSGPGRGRCALFPRWN